MSNTTASDPTASITVADAIGVDRLPFATERSGLAELASLAGKKALITGAGGFGLGAAAAHRLASAGASVALVDISAEGLKRVAADIGSQWAAPIHTIVADVSDWTTAAAVVDEADAELGGLDVLVNNVGGGNIPGYNTIGPFVERSEEEVNVVLQRNLAPVFAMTNAALKKFLPNRSGRIINIASEDGKIAVPDVSIYAACKSAIIGFTRCVAAEIGGQGVTAVCVCPGIMLAQPTIEALKSTPLDSKAGSAFLSHFERVSVGRAALPHEVANVVAFLATDAAGYIHGTAISVGGGMSD